MRLVIIVLMCFSANSACNASSLVEFSKATGLFICLVITSLILQYTVSGFRRSCPPVATKPKRVKEDKKGKTFVGRCQGPRIRESHIRLSHLG